MQLMETFFKEKGIVYKKNEALANYTTLRIGGAASFIAFPEDEQILNLLEVLKNEEYPFYIIGGGSNLLISDKGFKGVIINTKKMNEIYLDGFTLTVSAGVMLGRVVTFLAKRGLSGMEGLIGIPGTIGGAIKGNAGSFGYEIKDCFIECEIIDAQLKTKILTKNQINFQYRSSGLPDDVIICRAKFYLKESNGSIFNKMIDFLKKKQLTQPLRAPSAGCVFKNPPGFSAGELIDRAGLKGFKVGNIMVSPIHANYFINLGNGKASDFLKLMEIVKDRVFRYFGIELQPEIKILGDKP
ncbi:MAG: UDP-N-acetylmuramate dehydrogenase [Thermodesulfovibrio sp.]|uniref:UDP-N-acetylmuramate dehydrogenase n=1 Tax=unclassified Thermodesulfovibrio TaxID=2645936 RepID=UPI00083B8885|nr:MULTISPECIES: UDP-N-acetylmuramate dehydrogenase [unclassified Thermodesulfovibrio]MDI1472284.1 UDP-N-acetylmuramate dehydrogenase [Thermodesulfovibrio sp. 1176]MDI6714146.1 UDP-N-acetylmuramate dehydrogenase [Thermodesulfovibrio sp.]